MSEKLDLDAIEREFEEFPVGPVVKIVVRRLIARIRALESASQPGGGEADMTAWIELWDASREAYNATYAETRFQKRSHVKDVADRAEGAGKRLRAAMESTREAVMEARESISAAPSAGNGEAMGGRDDEA